MEIAGTSERQPHHVGTHVTESCERTRWPTRHLSRFGAAGALFASLCCLGFSALVSVLTAIGLGFLINDAILLPVLLMFLGVYVTGLVLGWRRHRRLPVLVLGTLAAAANFGFIYLVYVQAAAYGAVLLLIAVSIWDLVERRKADLVTTNVVQ